MERVDQGLGTTTAGYALGRARAWLTAGGTYPPDAGDLRTVAILGLRLPVRATFVVIAVTLLVLLDYHGRSDALLGSDGLTVDAAGRRSRAIARFLLEGVVPMLLVLLVLRDRPSRYGVRLGDVRAGVAIALVGCVAMTPVVAVMATLPFAFVHLGKPELETLSTVFGGLAYGWLNWRTGSVLWSGLAHTWILSLAVILAS